MSKYTLPQRLGEEADKILDDVCDTNFPETGGLIDETALKDALHKLALEAYTKGREDQMNAERAKATTRWCDES